MKARVVLYVEDDDAAFSLARIVLHDEYPQIQLVRASDGEQALAILGRLAPFEDAPGPDLILLDLNLPKKNGLEVLAELKANQQLRNIPVVMFSTSMRRSDRTDSLALGASNYVPKPTSFDSFVEAVKTACSLPDETSGMEPLR